jgi:PadR family transcriptional regulator PadR
MPADERKSAAFLNGVPELLILRLLADRGPMYGYEIVSAIRSSTGDVLAFGEGLVYPLLHGLEQQRLLSTRREMTNGRPRVYYKLTAAGKRRLADATGDWQRITAAVSRVLGAAIRQEPIH